MAAPGADAKVNDYYILSLSSVDIIIEENPDSSSFQDAFGTAKKTVVLNQPPFETTNDGRKHKVVSVTGRS